MVGEGSIANTWNAGVSEAFGARAAVGVHIVTGLSTSFGAPCDCNPAYRAVHHGDLESLPSDSRWSPKLHRVHGRPGRLLVRSSIWFAGDRTRTTAAVADHESGCAAENGTAGRAGRRPVGHSHRLAGGDGHLSPFGTLLTTATIAQRRTHQILRADVRSTDLLPSGTAPKCPSLAPQDRMAFRAQHPSRRIRSSGVRPPYEPGERGHRYCHDKRPKHRVLVPARVTHILEEPRQVKLVQTVGEVLPQLEELEKVRQQFRPARRP